MIKVDKIEVFNFEGAFRGLRNPLDSWAKSDSYTKDGVFVLGENDKKLAQRMLSGGTCESKFMRQIMVSMDITSFLGWWKEFDTYKIGTVANSCSTMHKITSKPMTDLNLYSWDEATQDSAITIDYFDPVEGKKEKEVDEIFNHLIYDLEAIRKKYLETKDQRYWRARIQLLPCAWNQKRTVTLNYQVLREMYFWRKNHKLVEWRTFCKIIEKLPYAQELICYQKGE